MNIRSMFIQFAGATMRCKLKGNHDSFFLDFLFTNMISQTSSVGLSWAPHYNTEFCLDIFSVSSSLFPFFHAKCFTSKLLIAPASHHRFSLFYLNSPLSFFSLSFSTLTFRRSHQTPGNISACSYLVSVSSVTFFFNF